MAYSVWINARFVTQPFSGVQRYAYEISRRLLDSGGAGEAEIRLVAPCGSTPAYASLTSRPEFNLSKWPLGRRSSTGHLWEQFLLPGEVPKGALLWSPGGSGPLRVDDQVLTIHDIAHLEHPEWYSKVFARWYRYLLPRLVKRVRRILTVSEYSRSRIVSLLDVSPEKVTAIPLAADPRFRPLDQDQIDSVLRKREIAFPYILAVSALSSRKNIARLIEAWRIVAERTPDVRLLVAGPLDVAFSDMSGGTQWPARMQHLGPAGDDELVALYNGALAYIYPSLYEGFGLPPLEAMACGTPVITAGVTSIPEVVGDAALLIDPYQVGSIADGMLKVIADTGLRQSLRERGLERAKGFTWDATAATTWQILRQTAAGL